MSNTSDNFERPSENTGFGQDKIAKWLTGAWQNLWPSHTEPVIVYPWCSGSNTKAPIARLSLRSNWLILLSFARLILWLLIYFSFAWMILCSTWSIPLLYQRWALSKLPSRRESRLFGIFPLNHRILLLQLLLNYDHNFEYVFKSGWIIFLSYALNLKSSAKLSKFCPRTHFDGVHFEWTMFITWTWSFFINSQSCSYYSILMSHFLVKKLNLQTK